MKKNILLLAVLALSFGSCQRTIDRSKVVTNPIDLDYEFTKGDSQQTSADMNIDFNDPNVLNSIPEEYKETVAQLMKVPGALQEMIDRMASPHNYREAADPVVTLYNDKYYLFVSKSDGYWSSDDMQHWRHIHSTKLPVDLYAPTSMVYNGELYWMTSDINQL